MRKIIPAIILVLAAVVSFAPAQAEINLDGFMQGLYGGRLDENNPTATEYTVSESRMQLRAEHFGERGEFFGRLDFVYDGSLEPTYDWELREGYFKFRMGNNIDVKVGRQILTWGTGDLIFINDLFAKDYASFFVGRDDQYLKAPQNAIRFEYYSSIGSWTLVWSPRYEPNRLPTGEKLSFYNPMAGMFIGAGMGGEVPLPESKFENSEIALRFNRQLGGFNSAAYFYKGFYKNPAGMRQADFGAGPDTIPYYPELTVIGASARGMLMGGILWLEGGYYNSQDDPDNDNPLVPNSSIKGLFGFERQIADNLTANLQWQVDMMTDYEIYKAQQTMFGGYVRDEVYHLLTSRVTKMLNSELIKLSGFLFYSPTDEDLYGRFSVTYKYTDEVTLTAGANIFDGENPATDFGQFQLNDNLYAKMTYGF
ncbi:MAG: hypothetical protein P1R58_01315 [bacterium]|nr:hypothetical protein [bacterium]